VIKPLIEPREFVGLAGVAHLCAGGEAPVLRSHLEALARFAADKGDGMAGRERMFETYRSAKLHLSWLVDRPASDIALLAHASEGVNLVAQSLDWRSGDNIVVADVEFPSMVYPWAHLNRFGVEIRVVPARNWYVALDDVRAMVDERTRVLAVSHVSYLTGQRMSLPALADIAWQAGARLLVDATHALGAVPVDANYCDFLVSSCYKWLLAVHGTGIFVWNRSRVPQLEPLSVGWHSVEHHAGWEDPTEVVLRADADRFEIGNPAFPSIYMLNNALTRLSSLSARDAEQHVLALSTRVREGLTRRGLKVMTPEASAERAGNVCFEWGDTNSLVRALAERGVQVWGGEGRIRVSTHVYDSSEDVDRFFTTFDDDIQRPSGDAQSSAT
jgi:selenocysteine lyase/cysteine desulfurase